jgi:hypothetical protein
MKNKLGFLAAALIAGTIATGTMFAQPRVSIGIGVGGYARGYYAPPVYAPVAPAYPGPGYTWVDGYWGPRNLWIQGYWRRPYVAAYPVGPRFVGPAYYGGFRGYDRGYAYRGGERRGYGFRR